jgi:hypothetical protein
MRVNDPRAGAPRRRVGAAGAVLALGASGFLAVATSLAPAAGPDVRAARALSVNDTGHLHLVNASGSVLQEEGPASGTLPGDARVRLVVHATVLASFAIEARGGGSIDGRGTAVLHTQGRYSSFAGSLSVAGGAGRYAHAHGGGRLYGVIDRRTDALTVQTIGQLHY